MNEIVFLVGAGASVDAGMPVVSELTNELRQHLPHLPDINGNRRSEFAEIFDVLSEYDPDVQSNFERFFEWLRFLSQAQTGAFKKALNFKLDQCLVDAVPYLEWSIKRPVWEILASRHQSSGYAPSYFAKLGVFLPHLGRLNVFTTNYDLCIEDACRSEGIEVVTGFCASTKQWNPSLFQGSSPGINLYKLHGSLSWGLNGNPTTPDFQPLIERYPPEWDKEPDIILGPGSKLQPDDPYAALYASFHQAVRRAGTCVVVGHSLRDGHIMKPVQAANHIGMKIIDVNPSENEHNFRNYSKLQMGAKWAFECNEILNAVNGTNHI